MQPGVTQGRNASQRGKAAIETAGYAKYAEGGTHAILFSAYSAYSAVFIAENIARRLRTI